MLKVHGDGLRTLPVRRVAVFCTLSLIIILCWSISSFETEYPYASTFTPKYNPTNSSDGHPSTTSSPSALCAQISLPSPSPSPAPALFPSSYVPTCGNETHAAARKIWLEAEARYSHLRDDKFTIVMPTYKRPDILNKTLTILLSKTIPSLHEIVILWNDLSTTPPYQNLTSPLGIPVRYLIPAQNSLNNRFIPDPSYQTQAIFSSDDDLWYESSDLEFAFQTWRQLGRRRITGALPRCHQRNGAGHLSYAQCGKGSDWYSLVLTGVAFIHISFLDFYSSPWAEEGVYAIPSAIRQHVDEVFNCEDLAMNYVVSMLTCEGPLHVIGKEPYKNLAPPGGISSSSSHWQKRAECLNYFEGVVGFFPLVQQMGSIQRGMPHYS